MFWPGFCGHGRRSSMLEPAWPQARWLLLYAPKLEIIDRDIVPHFPSEMHAAALAQLDGTPALPPIE